MSKLLTIFASFFIALSASAKVYKCINESGDTIFQQTTCASGSQQTKIKTLKQSAPSYSYRSKHGATSYKNRSGLAAENYKSELNSNIKRRVSSKTRFKEINVEYNKAICKYYTDRLKKRQLAWDRKRLKGYRSGEDTAYRNNISDAEDQVADKCANSVSDRKASGGFSY